MRGIENVLAAGDAVDVWVSIDDSVFERPNIRLVNFVGVAKADDTSGGVRRSLAAESSTPVAVDASGRSGVTRLRFESLCSSPLGDVLRFVVGFLPYVLAMVEGISSESQEPGDA
jgi:hypothetical protein